MGVGFAYGDTLADAGWSYGGFARFRQALAEHEGIDLSVMNGFRKGGDDRDRVSWDTVSSPLKPLLDHSDCDDELSPRACAAVAPYLRVVVAALPEENTYDRVNGLLLADAMEAAAAEGVPLEFC